MAVGRGFCSELGYRSRPGLQGVHLIVELLYEQNQARYRLYYEVKDWSACKNTSLVAVGCGFCLELGYMSRPGLQSGHLIVDLLWEINQARYRLYYEVKDWSACKNTSMVAVGRGFCSELGFRSRPGLQRVHLIVELLYEQNQAR